MISFPSEHLEFRTPFAAVLVLSEDLLLAVRGDLDLEEVVALLFIVLAVDACFDNSRPDFFLFLLELIVFQVFFVPLHPNSWSSENKIKLA